MKRAQTFIGSAGFLQPYMLRHHINDVGRQQYFLYFFFRYLQFRGGLSGGRGQALLLPRHFGSTRGFKIELCTNYLGYYTKIDNHEIYLNLIFD